MSDIADEWVEKAHRVYLDSGSMTLTKSWTREMLAAVADDIRSQERERIALAIDAEYHLGQPYIEGLEIAVGIARAEKVGE